MGQGQWDGKVSLANFLCLVTIGYMPYSKGVLKQQTSLKIFTKTKMDLEKKKFQKLEDQMNSKNFTTGMG